jgi:Ca-activated chloride channel homolog
MTFAWPVALLGLLAIPLAGIWYVVASRRRSRYAVVYPNVEVLASVVGAGRRVRRGLPVALFLLAATALILGLGRPEAKVLIPRDDATVVLVIDRSGSMQASDVEPTRLDAARQAAGAFIDVVPARFRLGLVAFSDTADVLARPTTKRERVRAGLATLEPVGGTAIGDALSKAVDLVNDDDGPAGAGSPPLSAVLLLSDGASTVGSDPLEAAAAARAAGVPVFTVALGADVEDDAFAQVLGLDAPDRDTLRAIAETTGGRFYDAPTQADLTRIYRELGSRMGFEWDRREVTAAFAFAGAALFLAAAFSSFKRRPRLP